MTAIAGGRGRDRGDNMLRNAARGAALIGAAVVIGIILLQVVDNGGGSGGPVGQTTDTTEAPSTGSTTLPADVRPPQEVAVLVLNASGTAQAAATKANELRGQGYVIAGTGNSAVQPGTTVACQPDYDAEADALATTVGNGATITAFPDPVPEGGETANCIVILGQ